MDNLMRKSREVLRIDDIKNATDCERYLDGIVAKLDALDARSQQDGAGATVPLEQRIALLLLRKTSLDAIRGATDQAALATEIAKLHASPDLLAIQDRLRNIETVGRTAYAPGTPGNLVRAHAGIATNRQLREMTADATLPTVDRTAMTDGWYEREQIRSKVARFKKVKIEVAGAGGQDLKFTTQGNNEVLVIKEKRIGVDYYVIKRIKPRLEEVDLIQDDGSPATYQAMFESAIYTTTEFQATPTLAEQAQRLATLARDSVITTTTSVEDKEANLKKRVAELYAYQKQLQDAGTLEFREVFNALRTAEAELAAIPSLDIPMQTAFARILLATPEVPASDAATITNLEKRYRDLQALSVTTPPPLGVIRITEAMTVARKKVVGLKVKKALSETDATGKTGAAKETVLDARLKKLNELNTEYSSETADVKKPITDALAIFNTENPNFVYDPTTKTGGIAGGGEGGRDVAEAWDRRSEVSENVVFKDENTLKDALLARFVKEKTAHLNVPITPERIALAKATLERYKSAGTRMLFWGAITMVAAAGGGLFGTVIASALIAKGMGLFAAGAIGLGSGILGSMWGRQALLRNQAKRSGSEAFGMTFQEHMRASAALNRAAKEFHPSSSLVPGFLKSMLGMHTSRDEHDHYAHSRALLGASTAPMTVSYKKAMEAWEAGSRNENKRLFAAGLIGGVAGGVTSAYVVDNALGQFGFKRPAKLIIGGIGEWWNAPSGSNGGVLGQGTVPRAGAVGPESLQPRGPGAGVLDGAKTNKWICFNPDGSMKIVTPESIQENARGLRGLIAEPQWEVNRRFLTGFGTCDHVTGSRGGFEAFVKRTVPGVNWDCLGFGAGVKSPFTDLFMNTLSRDEYLSRTFFSWPDGARIPRLSNGMIDVSSMESVARRCGRGLDFNVLNEVGNGSKKMINLMMERAGGGERGELMRQVLRTMQRGVMSNSCANTWVGIAR